MLDPTPWASIVIPAHNEATVIGRALDALADGDALSGVEVVVACNGCTDDTAAVATRHGSAVRARVLDLEVASKPAALNAADRVCRPLPRLYLDADVELSGTSARTVLRVLRDGAHLAGRPPLRYDTTGCSPLVAAFYRARSRTPSLMTALWGAGCFGVSAAGRARWSTFPERTADDLFVQQRFAPDEIVIVDAPAVVVRTPRTARTLLSTLRRVYRARHDVPGDRAGAAPPPASSSLRELLVANRRPGHWVDAAVYVALALLARTALAVDRGSDGWERDETSRRS